MKYGGCCITIVLNTNHHQSMSAKEACPDCMKMACGRRLIENGLTGPCETWNNRMKGHWQYDGDDI
jgi:hypothetical protein